MYMCYVVSSKIISHSLDMANTIWSYLFHYADIVLLIYILALYHDILYSTVPWALYYTYTID